MPRLPAGDAQRGQGTVLSGCQQQGGVASA